LKKLPTIGNIKVGKKKESRLELIFIPLVIHIINYARSSAIAEGLHNVPHTHTQHTTVLRLSGFCPGQPG